MKRLIDLLVAVLCLIIFSPLLLICYLAVKLEDGGPAIFKFRSMTIDKERDENALFGHEKNKNMTKIGRFLRDHHLDELPQLWNVVKGDMAFIGPRPERKYYIDLIMQHDPRYERLYALRPGVTSYATLHNGYTDTMEKMLIRLEMDLYYLEHQSLWLDARILMETFFSIISGKHF